MRLKFESLSELEEFMTALGWVKADQLQSTAKKSELLQPPSVAKSMMSDTKVSEVWGVASAMDRHPQDPRPHSEAVDWVGPPSIDMNDFAKMKTVRQVVTTIKAQVPHIDSDQVVETCRIMVSKDKCPVLALLPAEDMEARVRGACESLGID